MSLQITEETTFLLDMTNEAQYGPVLNVSNCMNIDYTSFANGTPTGFDATSDGGGSDEAGTADEISLVSGNVYHAEFDLVLNSGTAPFCDIGASIGGPSGSSEGATLSSAGSNVFNFTSTVTTTGVFRFQNTSTTTDFEITNLSVRLTL